MYTVRCNLLDDYSFQHTNESLQDRQARLSNPDDTDLVDPDGTTVQRCYDDVTPCQSALLLLRGMASLIRMLFERNSIVRCRGAFVIQETAEARVDRSRPRSLQLISWARIASSRLQYREI